MTTAHLNGITLSPENAGGDGTVKNAVRSPYIEIVEQPASKALRFRYECEGRSAGSIPGVHNTPEHKTYPTVRIVGYTGRAVIIVSCVTKDEPYKAHPHNLVGKEGCKNGICTVELNGDNMTATFSNLGIQCVKKKDIEDALKIREEKRVDPFRQGFAHSTNPSSIDLNAVRLCFQAFLNGPELKKLHVLKPVVSDVIYDKKAMSDLVITKLSHASAPALSRQEMILLCEKVTKEDILVRFYEEIDGAVVWESVGEFTPSQVHKQVAIWFKTPHYNRISELDRAVDVKIQLKRPSDGALSEPLPFKFTPEDSGYKRPRKRPTGNNLYGAITNSPQIPSPAFAYQLNPQQQPMNTIKVEPCPSPEYMPAGYPRSPYNHQMNSPVNHNYIYTSSLSGFAPGYMLPEGLLPSLVSNSSVQENIVSTSEFDNTIRSNVNLSSLEQNLDSRDLVHDDCPMDAVALSNNLSATLNITGNDDHQNMTDSLTRLANETVDNMELLYKEL